MINILLSKQRYKGSTKDAASSTSIKHMQAQEDISKRELKAKEQPPEFIIKPRKKFVDEGKTATFKASFEGSPQTKLYWQRNGEYLKSCEKYKIYEALDFHYLEIQDVEMDDGGSYTCVIENSAGKDSVDTVLEIFESYKPTSQTKVSKPEVEVPLRDSEPTEGEEEVVLECKFSNAEEALVTWYKDGQQLKQGTNIRYTFNGSIAQLTLLKITMDEIGKYECVATKRKHEARTHSQLVVKALTKPKLGPPIFIRELKDTEASSGSRVELTVQMKGTPPLSIYWVHNNIDILPNDPKYKLIEKENNSKLIIRKVKPEDAGKYVCEVYNDYGDTDTSCELTVKEKESLTGPIEPVRILEMSTAELTVKIGETARLKATYTGEPVSYILWYRGRLPVLVDEKITISNVSGASELIIQNIQLTDKGTYCIVIGNSLGDDSSAAKVNVEEESIFDGRDVQISKAKFEDFYMLKEEVGKGRFGNVYKCVEKSTKRIWAAKVIKCKEKEKNNIRQEIEIMNEIAHPKVLGLWDAFETIDSMVLIMEYISGGELFLRIIDDDFVLTEADCALFMLQICQGVSYIHDKSIIHLDLKPENILCISKDSNLIKIIDFGLARRFNSGDSIRVMFGTADFIAPEVVNYEDIGFATDIWSLGVICYVLLCGHVPFTGETEAETLANVTRGHFDFDDELFADISSSAKHFIKSMLVKKKEERISINQCLKHEWLAQDVTKRSVKRLSTDKLKSFLAKRKWQG